MTNQNLLLQDFGLSTFAQDIFKSTLNNEEELRLQKQILQQRRDKLNQERGDDGDGDDDDDDDDIPLSKCILDQPSDVKRIHHQKNIQQQQQPYSILEDETLHEDDDEDLLPIGVLQDPKAKLLHPCQSAAEKYKNSILCRDPQLKVSASQRQQQRRYDQGGSSLTNRDRSRRSSFDPASIHHLDLSSSELTLTKPVVMRSFSANQQKKRHIRLNVNHKPGVFDDDDDDDIPLFQTCIGIPPSNPSNVKVPH
ncbi:hypothetical protein BC941DRAFT_477772 [Chlamydoabsidia padenii]|nr:hypothetical protein BC941DRAFT_477772 [Chlamydoabsidia padenii]